MEKLVVTILDDVCEKNEKTATMQADLVKKLKEYGIVETYDEHMKSHDAQWQKIVNELKAELNRVKAVACKNDFELAVVKACRAAVDNEVSAVNVEKEKYRIELANNKEKLEALRVNITKVLGE